MPRPPPTNPPSVTGRHAINSSPNNGRLQHQNWEGSGSILFPERYLQSHGLNIKFGGSRSNRTVHVQQVVMRNGKQHGIGAARQYGVRFGAN